MKTFSFKPRTYANERRYVSKMPSTNHSFDFTPKNHHIPKNRQANASHQTKTPKEVFERKRVEETYRILEKAVEQSIDGIAVADMKGIIRFANLAWAKMHGYGIEELLGKHLRIFHTKEQMRKDIRPFNEQVKKKGFHHSEVGHVRRDGSIFLTSMSTSLLKDEKGKTIGILGIARDITECRRIEDALKNSESQHRIALDSMADAIHVVNKNLRFVLFNTVFKKWTEELGLETDVIGKGIFEVFPFLSEKVHKEYQEVFKSGKILITEEHNKAGEKDFITETRKIPIFEKDKVVQVLTIVRDITERKRVREELRRTGERFKQVAENAQEWIWEVDTKGLYTYSSPTVEKILGYRQEEIVGKKHFYDLFHPEDRQEMKKKAFEAFAKKQPFRKLVNRNIHKNSRIIWLSTSGVPVLDKKGKLLGYRGADADITERKLAEKVLRKSEEKYRFLFEKSTVFTLVVDVYGEIVDVNTSSLESLGYSKKEVIGTKVLEYVILRDKKKARKALEKAFKGQVSSREFEVNVYNKDKSIHTLLFSPGQVLFYGESRLPRVLLSGIDITQRKQGQKRQDALTKGLRAIVEVADELISYPDTETVFRKAVEFVREKLNLERCAIFVEEDTCMRGTYGTDHYGCTTDERTNCLSKDKVWMLRLKMLCPGDPRWVVVKEPYVEWDGKKAVTIGEGWIAVTPIQSADKSIGVFVNDTAISKAPLDAMQQEILAVFCSLLGDIIERKRAEKELAISNRELIKSNRRLKQLALRDSHTGLYNHRYLQEAIKTEFYRAKRYAQPLSVLMLDLDYFKSINDVYGHQFGDLVLKQFARRLRKIVRQCDIVIRFGGEEFIIIFPEIDRITVLNMAQRLLDNITASNFGDDEHNVKLKLSGDRVYSSFSIKNSKTKFVEKDIQDTDVDLLKEKIDRLNKRANQSLIEAVFAFAKTIKLKDQYTGEHVENTVLYAAEIARKLNLSIDEVENIRSASMVHDLGKIGISERILLKEAKLTKEEFDEIKKHPRIGVNVLRPIHSLHDIIPFVLHHHERWDGKGYPDGLKEEEIPLGARIVAVADVYQALISNRPYRRAFSDLEAKEMIKEGSGTQFDPRIVNTFLEVAQN